MASDGESNRVPQAATGLPRDTTPTWEVELLISGVAVFAMLQLPGWLDDRWFALAPRFDATWVQPLEFMYLYAKTAATLLAATFVVHLLLRAHWIAAVGMHSVHPGGIAWDKLRMGPVQREVERARYGTPEAAIERFDNRATTVFAIGVALASLLLVVAIVVPTGLLLMLLGARVLGVPVDGTKALLGGILLALAPSIVAALVDRAWGERFAPESGAHRVLSRIFEAYVRLGFARSGNPTLALFSSRGGRVRTMLLTFVLMTGAVFVAMLGYRAQRDPQRVGQYDAFPKPSATFADAIDPSHYDDQRNPDRDHPVPYIGSAVATGPYLRLVVPYAPRSDAPALARGCPTPAGKDDVRAAAMLACLRRLHALRLDGTPLPVEYLVGADPRTDRPALVAMLDIRALAPGRHALEVALAPVPGEKPSPASARIVFWH